jgi:Tol biopolymer transport system component
MTDRELKERLRAWYAGEVAETDTAPADLRERIAAIPASHPTPLRPLGRRRDLRLLAVAAILLVGGALAAGAGLLRMPFVVRPAPSDALLVAPEPSTSEAPAETASPTASPKPWITGQQLADRLSRENGYTWVPQDAGDGRTILSSEPSDSSSIRISPPFDSRANVEVSVELAADAEAVGPDVDRIAQALSPDVAAWIHDAFTQGRQKPGGGVAWTNTASGGSVGVAVVDEVVMNDWVHVSFSPDPLPPVRTEPIAAGSVVYADSGFIRVANPDGTDAGSLLGGAYDPRVPTAPDVARVLGWSPDGSQLFYVDAGGALMRTDARGSEPTLIGRSDRIQDRCKKLSDPEQAKCVADLAGVNELCPAVTVDDTCEPNVEEVLISPDGTRLAYPITDDSGLSTIGFLDLATGQVTRIAFDSERRPGGPACEGPPAGGGPLQWSPDGTRFALGRSIGPKVDGWCQGAIFTVNVDGTDLRRLTPAKVHALDPRWSPDGSTIVFSSMTPRSAWDGKTDATRIPIDTDVYSVRPDGSDLTALTSDGVSILPYWTRDGRIVFSHINPDRTSEPWIMDADGANPTRLDTTVAAQTAAGCTVCPYWPSESGPFQDGGPFLRFWRPGQP